MYWTGRQASSHPVSEADVHYECDSATAKAVLLCWRRRGGVAAAGNDGGPVHDPLPPPRTHLNEEVSLGVEGSFGALRVQG